MYISLVFVKVPVRQLREIMQNLKKNNIYSSVVVLRLSEQKLSSFCQRLKGKPHQNLYVLNNKRSSRCYKIKWQVNHRKN